MIHVFNEDGEWQVWWDLVKKQDGICIGDGASREEALLNTNLELLSQRDEIKRLMACKSHKKKKPSPAR